MTLKATLENDLKVAMKAKDTATTGVLRLLLSAMKNEELSKRAELDDANIIAVLSSQVKQRRESIEAFTQAGRDELAAKEQAELEIIQKYLPKPLAQDELERIVDDAIMEANAESPKDMGRVMKLVVPKTQGRADGKAVSELVRNKLTK